MTSPHPFAPGTAATVSVSCSTSSNLVALPTGAGFDKTLRVLTTNGADVVYIELGSSTVAAAVATGMPLIPAVERVLQLRNGQTHIAGITSSSSAKLYVTLGEGGE